MSTESQVLQHCFITTDCFRATVQSGVKIINYKNNLGVAYKPSPLYHIMDVTKYCIIQISEKTRTHLSKHEVAITCKR